MIASCRWARMAAVVLLAVTLLGGCAQQRIRDASQRQLREAQYEKAIAVLEAGLKDHPQSALLRAGLLQTRSEATTNLLAQAAAQRAAGKLDAAEALLRRAQSLEAGGNRAAALLSEVAVERRQRAALAEAETLVEARKPQAALAVITEALKDNPRHADLLALQRTLEADARRTQARAARLGLAESRPISLDFRDASLRTVLDVVTRNSGINFILDKDIRTDIRVTALLNAIRLEDAIDLIVSTHQLAKKVVDAQTVLIYPNTPEKSREHQEHVVRVFYLASAEAKGAAAFLRSMLRIREPFVDERSNMLALRDSADNIELAERLITLYDTPEAEVLLELEVLEVRTSRLTDLGIKFPDTIGLTPLAPSGSTGLTLGNIRGLNSDRVGLSVSGLLLSLRREVGDLNTLANPRIRVRNKEKAKVLIGDKVPLITATTSQGGFVADSVSYIDVGLKLDVEPTVYADDEVAIRVNLEVSSLAREVRTNSGSLAYQIGTRSASTMLRLRDGETQLLAGLISNEERSSASRLPGLGDLPVAGRLFSSQRDEANRTELVLAITPRVLRNLRRGGASETELWVGTETSPRLRTVGGLLPQRAAPAADAAAGTAPAAGAAPPSTSTSTSTPAAAAAAATPMLPLPLLPPPAPTPRLAVKWLAPAEVAVGESFVATLELDSPAPLRGMPMQLRYTADRVQVIDVEEGDYFRADGSATSFTKAIDASEGTVRAGVLRNKATGAQGLGQVLRLRLKAIKAGPAEVSVVALEPVSMGLAVPIPPLPQTLRLSVK